MSDEVNPRHRPPEPVIEIFKASLRREIAPVTYLPYTFHLTGLDVFRTFVNTTSPRPITEPSQWFPRKVRSSQIINAIIVDGFPFDRLPYNHALQVAVDRLISEWVRLKLVECVDRAYYRLSGEGRWVMTYVVADFKDLPRIGPPDWE